jgi:hypothetical protein
VVAPTSPKNCQVKKRNKNNTGIKQKKMETTNQNNIYKDQLTLRKFIQKFTQLKKYFCLYTRLAIKRIKNNSKLIAMLKKEL